MERDQVGLLGAWTLGSKGGRLDPGYLGLREEGWGLEPLGLRKENQSRISRPEERGIPLFHLLRSSKETAVGSAALQSHTLETVWPILLAQVS